MRYVGTMPKRSRDPGVLSADTPIEGEARDALVELRESVVELPVSAGAASSRAGAQPPGWDTNPLVAEMRVPFSHAANGRSKQATILTTTLR